VSQGLAVVSDGRSDPSHLLRPPLVEPSSSLLEVAGTESPSVATQENANDAPSHPTTLLWNETKRKL
jgi:hypothetical protein